MHRDDVKQVGQGVLNAGGAAMRWAGNAVVQIAPPAFKWTAVVVVSGFASITVMASVFFLSIENDSEIILGVLDRVERIETQAQEHRLEVIRAERSALDAELLNLSEDGEIKYCVNDEYDRIYLDSTQTFKVWHDDPNYEGIQ